MNVSKIRNLMKAAKSQATRNSIFTVYESWINMAEEITDEQFAFMDELSLLCAELNPKVQAKCEAALRRQVELGFAPADEDAFRRGYIRRAGAQNPCGYSRWVGSFAQRSEAHGEWVRRAEREANLMERMAVEFYGPTDAQGRANFIRGWEMAAAGGEAPKAVNRVSRARMYGHKTYSACR